MSAAPAGRSAWLAAAPAIFVFLWSTGFVVAKYGLPYAPPLKFLAMRFALTIAVLLPIILALRASWPSREACGHLVVSGLLVHAGYLSGVWCAIELGMPAGVSALIVNLQPILTAAAGPWLGERVGPKHWLGLVLGFAGVLLVVGHKVSVTGMPQAAVWLCVMSLLSITAGTLYQKKHAASFDLRTGTAIQYAASLAVVGPLAWLLEDEGFEWTAEFAIAMAWSVLGLSIGAIFLMFMLMARGSATRVASLFYLVPPSTAILAWLMFGESYGWPAAAGMVLAALGVAMVQRSR